MLAALRLPQGSDLGFHSCKIWEAEGPPGDDQLAVGHGLFAEPERRCAALLAAPRTSDRKLLVG